MRNAFARFAHWTANAIGTPAAFVLSLAVVAVWAAFGPYFRWSDTHQLIINTGTTIVTFWMVFLVQATMNRDTRAIHTKLDALIASIETANNRMIGAEELSDQAIRQEQAQLHRLAVQARADQPDSTESRAHDLDGDTK